MFYFKIDSDSKAMKAFRDEMETEAKCQFYGFITE